MKINSFPNFFFAGYASNFFNTTKVGHERNSVALSTLALCLSGTSIKMTLGSELRTNGTFFRPIYEVTMSITVQDYWWSQMSIGTTNFCWYTAHCLKISQNVSFWICQFWHFPPIFVLLKMTCQVTLFDRKFQVFKNSPKLTIFGIFNELLSTQNVNVARFARNVECDFLRNFQTLWLSKNLSSL